MPPITTVHTSGQCSTATDTNVSVITVSGSARRGSRRTAVIAIEIDSPIAAAAAPASATWASVKRVSAESATPNSTISTAGGAMTPVKPATAPRHPASR